MTAGPPAPAGDAESTDRVPTGVPSFGSRVAAGGALICSAGALAVLTVFTARNLLYVTGSLLAAAFGISALWIAATNRRYRWMAAVAAALLIAGVVVILVVQGRGAVAVAIALVGILAACALGSLALRWEIRRVLARRWHSVPATRHGVLIMNPRSGDGKVARFDLVAEAHRRGVESVLLGTGDDLAQLAEAAVGRGADALGMAGGDGSQAVVAAVAATHGLPFICVPAGTRNHLALDLGIDRDDPVKALDAFGAAREASIDLAEMNGEVFVNNVSLGLYARIVATEEYRGAKRQTVAEMLPELLGPDAEPPGLVVEGPDGPITGAQVIQISNNPYRLNSLTGLGSRPSLDTGMLGVATLTVNRPADVSRLVALEAAGHPERYGGWCQWSARHLEVGGPPSLAVAVDGEARTRTPPLHFAIRPAALRIRIAHGQRGASPAFLTAPVRASTLVGLGRIVAGRPSGIVASIGTEGEG
ncbi:MAG: diacylglycerol kinase family protein [Acidimicrobiales bacterium]